MKCKVCGAESGKYPLCKVCNIKKEKGEIIKCNVCGKWHLTNTPCDHNEADVKISNKNIYLYDLKRTLISNMEQNYFSVITSSLPSGYHAFPQVNLASFIIKNDNSPFHNELFRNVDFLITNESYTPLFIIEINDQTHLNKDRKERDEKVKNICEEAGIPIIKLWTSYGINSDYIRKKINETISSLPPARIHHFAPKTVDNKEQEETKSFDITNYNKHRKRRYGKSGCYVATCIYGSYDCPEVWVLRRYRDNKLQSSFYGRLFIKIYYFISPMLVSAFGEYKWFHRFIKPMLDKFVNKLIKKGYEHTAYRDLY